MKALLVAVSLLLSASVASANITITGTGKVTYAPDIAHVRLGASAEGKTAAEAWQKNAAIVKKVFDALKALGLPVKDLQTSNLNVSPRYHHTKDQPPRLLGYTATYDLQVTVRDLEKLGAILDTAVEAGANRNVGISFGIADPERLMDQARARAIAEARKKADLYVRGAGASLGQVLTINEGNVAPWRHFRFDLAERVAGAPMPIAAGEQDMSVTVTVTYAIVHTNGLARP